MTGHEEGRFHMRPILYRCQVSKSCPVKEFYGSKPLEVPTCHGQRMYCLG